MTRIACFFAVLLFVALAASSATAQTSLPPENFLAIDSAFTGGQYDQVELLVLRRLQSDTSLTPDETARLCLLAGYSLIMLDREPDARTYFSRALDAVPDLKLDPVQVSPKFRMVFEDVAAHHVTPEVNAGPILVTHQSSPRLRAVAPRGQLINLVLPGVGQMRAGHTLRGAVFLTAQAATIGVFLWRMNELHQSRADYLAETDNARIQTTYNSYNRDYRWAWGTGAAVGVVYLAAQADLIRLTARASAGQPQAAIYPGFASAPLALRLQISW